MGGSHQKSIFDTSVSNDRCRSAYKRYINIAQLRCSNTILTYNWFQCHIHIRHIRLWYPELSVKLSITYSSQHFLLNPREYGAIDGNASFEKNIMAFSVLCRPRSKYSMHRLLVFHPAGLSCSHVMSYEVINSCTGIDVSLPLSNEIMKFDFNATFCLISIDSYFSFSSIINVRNHCATLSYYIVSIIKY